MADLRDFTGKNRKFTGTIGERISIGSTGERDTSFGGGTLRFNSSTNLMEYYTGTEWKSIDAPPTITSVTVDGGADTTSGQVDNESSGNVTIEVKGSLFDTVNGNVTFVGTSETLTPATQTRNNSGLFTCVLPASSFDDANSPYTVKVTNGSGLSAELVAGISADQSAPAFITGAGTLGTITDSTRSSYTLSSAAATDADGDTITYSISAGSLPTGLSLNSSTAAITGTASAVGSNTTSTFTVSAATAASTSTRQFTITVNAPVVTSYTATGAFTFTVPAGVTSVRAFVVAGGGGGAWIGGGGGAGGIVEHTSFPVTPGGTVSGSVGTGGPAAPGSTYSNQGPWNGRGGDSTFGTLTAKGGGSTQGWIYQPDATYLPGGSGGGSTNQTINGGTAIQPAQPNPGATNYGFPGSRGGGADVPTTGAGTNTGGGGGGAGTAGGHPTTSGPGNTSATSAGRFGGNGLTSTVSGSSVVYGGGGAGSSHQGNFVIGPVPGGTGGGGPATDGAAGTPGTNNRGGGGGGGYYPDYNGGSGGSGIVIVRY